MYLLRLILTKIEKNIDVEIFHPVESISFQGRKRLHPHECPSHKRERL